MATAAIRSKSDDIAVGHIGIAARVLLWLKELRAHPVSSARGTAITQGMRWAAARSGRCRQPVHAAAPPDSEPDDSAFEARSRVGAQRRAPAPVHGPPVPYAATNQSPLISTPAVQRLASEGAP